MGAAGAESADLRFEVDDGVALITLDRPDQGNAFTGRMGAALSDAYARCDADDAVRAVVLTGAGPAFCVGADMAAGAETFAARDEASFSSTPVTVRAWEVRKPVIAALNGHAIGIGFTLALHCDLRLVADAGRYGVLQVRRGVMPDCEAHWTLPRLVGMAKAADILLTGRRFDGPEAVRLGVASRSLPADAVLPAALETARDIARNTAPVSVAVTKKLMWQSLDLSARQTEAQETALHHVLMRQPDAVEGVTAFLERRAPDWQGRLSRDWPEWPEPPGDD